MLSSLEYARLCCDTMMKKYKSPSEIPPTPKFHYHAGVFLMGMEGVCELCGEEKYENYVKGYIDTYVDSEGNLSHANLKQLDDIQPCTLLYRYCDEKENYRKVLDRVVPLLLTWPTIPQGGFWHKEICPEQVWLDGMYMSGVLGVKYGLLSGRREFINIIRKEFDVMWENMRDKETGLLYHAWDYAKKEEWAVRENGCSGFFWGRALGWYAVASADISELLANDPDGEVFTKRGLELMNALLKYQDSESGMWYQVVDKGDRADNWTETSCSCLFLYTLCSFIRCGLLDESLIEHAKLAFRGIVEKKLRVENDELIISDICIGTGVGDYDFYINRPTSDNDLHGTGAFLLMCCEYEKLKRTFPEKF